MYRRFSRPRVAQLPPSIRSHSADRVSDMSKAVRCQFVQDEAAVGVHAAMIAAVGGAVYKAAVHMASSLFIHQQRTLSRNWSIAHR